MKMAKKKTEEKLLVDYFEDAAEFLREKKEQLARLEKEYKQAYSRDVREEMDEVKKEINKKMREIADKLYENAEEVRSIKKYFPEFFETLLEEPEIGKILKNNDVIYDRLKFPQADRHLQLLRESRAQLRDAIRFLEKWPGVIKEKQLTATYPILKGAIKGDMESTDAIEKIKEMDKILMREGWKVIVSNENLLGQILDRYMQRLRLAKLDVMKKTEQYEQAKGRGSITEYSALKTLKNAEKKVKKIEKQIRRLLLLNPDFLDAIKKNRGWLARMTKSQHFGLFGNYQISDTTKKSELEKIAESVAPKKIREKIWLEEMSKRLR
jgi:hypothetical protein